MNRFTFFGSSDIGLGRSKNEDVWIAVPEIGFFAIADGMGGHQAGEIAAKEAIDTLVESIHSFGSPLSPSLLRKAIEHANRWVYQLGREDLSLRGMGTTLCCLSWTSDAVLCAHAGDSRAYRLRGNHLEQLTEDHSLWTRWRAVSPKANQSRTPYPYKHVITKALGTKTKADPEVVSISYESSDVFLLCSDGLSDVVDEGVIRKILLSTLSINEKGTALIEEAKIKGSRDNITALIVQFDDTDLSRQQRYHPY